MDALADRHCSLQPLVLRSGLVLLAACHISRPPVAAPVQVDTTIVFTVAPESSGSFPQLPNPEQTSPDGDLLADPSAMPCDQSVPRDTTGWRTVSTTIPTRYLRAITLRLPPQYAAFPDRSSEEDSEPYAEDRPMWEHILGSWWTIPVGARDPSLPSSFAIWIGPRQGFPSVGVSGSLPRQVRFEECRLDAPVGRINVAIFTVVDSAYGRLLRTQYVSAYWLLTDGAWLTAMGDGPERPSPTDFLFVLRTVRVLPR